MPTHLYFFTDIACFDLCALGQDCVIEIMAVLQKNPEILCLDKTVCLKSILMVT